jgi:hypothetical protein
MPHRRIARFSVLDFWGNRKDVDVPVSRIQPPFAGRSVAEVRAAATRTLLPITLKDGGHQFFVSIRHGQLLQKEVRVQDHVCIGL